MLYKRAVPLFLTILLATAPALNDQVAAAPALAGIRSFVCPQFSYQAHLAGTPDLQAKAIRAQQTQVNDSSCGNHPPLSPDRTYRATTGTDPNGRAYDAMCPKGRDFWIKSDPSILTEWKPCLAAERLDISPTSANLDGIRCVEHTLIHAGVTPGAENYLQCDPLGTPEAAEAIAYAKAAGVQPRILVNHGCFRPGHVFGGYSPKHHLTNVMWNCTFATINGEPSIIKDPRAPDDSDHLIIRAGGG